MPEMNGDEFISELRKFDNETVVILRTGYSDKVPPLEIIDELNIQGYIDKIKGKDELILLTKSAIKTSFLNRTIKKQERMIEAEQYRNEFFGKFLYRFIGEVRERVFVIGGLIDSVTVDEQGLSLEEKKQYSQHIKEAIGKLMKIVESLEIEKISMLTVSTLEDILNSLFAISLEANKANLKFKYDNEYTSFQCDPKTLIYILVEIVEYLLNNNIKEINIDCEKQKEITIIKIGNMIKDEKVIAKIISISCIDNKIRIIKELNQVKIEVNS
jgi:CheY-like chemotaxis protein